MRVAALVPAYQAAAHLGEVLLRLQALPAPPDTLVVDDGSRDGTADVARSFGARLHSFAANRGKGHALLKGFELLSDYEAVVTIDADGQHPPECFPAFVAAAEAGADLVLGARPRSRDMPGLRRFANGMSSGWTSALAGRAVSDSQCGYRLYGRDVIARTPMTAGRYELETEIIVRAARLGFQLAEVTVPTVYGDEQSQFRLVRDVPRIVGTLLRLSIEGVLPPAAMRAARRSSRPAAERTR
ncbi:MAG: glycosyltransferase family 2 protein [Candidatus Eisenbacteria bacterium]|uniref:Glycosyltransferase family 2 protein n=1 Tax=Eiseniibacteriota bacterium TaxID=2212470 RepID=A0A538SEH5_UNCEI|nr:MAG: glycosyltransferase family 2 protein [Candidatus Eisenbacteria bacterium]